AKEKVTRIPSVSRRATRPADLSPLAASVGASPDASFTFDASAIGAGVGCDTALEPSDIAAGASLGNCSASGGGGGTTLAAVSGLISIFACCAIISEVGGITSPGCCSGADSWEAFSGAADAAATGAAGAA